MNHPPQQMGPCGTVMAPQHAMGPGAMGPGYHQNMNGHPNIASQEELEDLESAVSRLGIWTTNSSENLGIDSMSLLGDQEGVKIFVGGLARQTKSQDLAGYFGRFGPVLDAVVMYNHSLGVSRGFGFVTFQDRDISHYVLSQRHSIHNKSVEAKLAVPRDPASRGPRREGPRVNRKPGRSQPSARTYTKQQPMVDPANPNMTGPQWNLDQPGNQQGPDPPQALFPGAVTMLDTGCKLFIGGLSWDTDEAALTAYFSRFGEVVDAMVVYNHTMGVSRGFGFVTFKERGVAEAMVTITHCINEKTVEAKLALPKGEHVAESLEEKMSKQIFVGGLPHNTTSDQLKEWAQRQFGPHNLSNAIAVIDLKTKVTRGFGFIQFTTPEMVDFAVQTGLHYEMNAKKVTVKRAQAHHPTMPGQGGEIMVGMYQNSVPMSVYQELLAMGGY